MSNSTSSNSTLSNPTSSNYTSPAPTSSPGQPSAGGANVGGARFPPGPPYPPTTAQLGGMPTTSLDVPVSVVLILFFLAGAAFHMTIYQRNRKRGYKFLFSTMLFGFCMARVTALSVRMAWATHPTSIVVGIVAGILTAMGVLFLFIINLIFAQRILRACHPFFGWRKPVNATFKTLYITVVATLAMVIAATIQSFLTLDVDTRATDRYIQLFAATYLAILAFLPTPIVLLTLAVPRYTRVEKFGQGSFHTKVGLLITASLVLTLGAAFRAGVAYEVRPLTQPAWFHSKACYYCFNYVLELIVVYTYGISRFDKRFYVPNGSCAPGHYAGGLVKGASYQRRLSTYHFARQQQAQRAMYRNPNDSRAMYTQSTLFSHGKRSSMYPSSVYTWTDRSVDRQSHYHASGRAPSMYSYADADAHAASSSHDQEWMERATRELYADKSRW